MENLEKYQNERTWKSKQSEMQHLKPTLIPVIVGALGKLKKAAKEYLQQIPVKTCQAEIQKTVLTSTAHVLRKALPIQISNKICVGYIY